jgi:hypothetical protein
MAMKLSTTLSHIRTVPNSINSKAITEFYHYMKSIGTSFFILLSIHEAHMQISSAASLAFSAASCASFSALRYACVLASVIFAYTASFIVISSARGLFDGVLAHVPVHTCDVVLVGNAV